MALTLTRHAHVTNLPVNLDALRPDTLAALNVPDIARITLPVGNGSAPVGDLFDIQGDGSDSHLIVDGDLSLMSGLGRGMTSGTLTVRGHAGNHLGAAMSGGTITVEGDAGGWAGAAMSGGMIQIHGSAGDHLGSAEPGARLGMREGVILVRGAIGAGAGLAMRRGLIAVLGPAGDDLGHDLIAGSIFAFGAVGARPGAGLKRGTITLFGGEEPRLLPTFRPGARYRPPFLTIYLRQLQAWRFPVPDAAFAGPVDRYNGDLLTGGKGEILLWGPR